ncbi:MAG: helix-hairpin-helix domain-containing protein, partial [Bacteroidales bacterium]|nr:helix-hairpin-helix domain-containing protein [Bacteroidales bacterium]
SNLLHTSENSVAENSSSATYSSDPSPGGSSNGGWKTPRPKVYIDLNEADSAALLSVRGIGPYFCKAILSYRKSLGSFANIDQLLEIKGMDQEKFDRIKDQVFVHPGGILKFSIAEASRAFLERHPYIGSYNARGIALFLETHSKEECTLKALVENRILSPEDTLRLHPYIR